MAAELGSIVPTPSGSARLLTAVCGQCQAVFCLSIKPEDLGLRKANLQHSVPGQVRPRYPPARLCNGTHSLHLSKKLHMTV